MSNTNLMDDPELVKCAEAMYYRWYSIPFSQEPQHEQYRWLRQASDARDFFRERWKPGPTPDFSGDPERVALANTMLEQAHRLGMGLHCASLDATTGRLRELMLVFADAAITHLGSGYRLPEANEANAEQLARAYYGDIDKMMNADKAIYASGLWLQALTAAFPECAEKPEPVFAGMPAPSLDPRDLCSCGHMRFQHEPRCRNCTNCHAFEPMADEDKGEPDLDVPPSANDILDSEARISETRPESEVRLSALWFKYASLVMNDANGPADAVQILCSAAGKLSEDQLGAEARINSQPAKDPVREGERRKERQELVWEHYQRHASLDRPLSWMEEVADSVSAVDAYLAWRDADNAKAMEAYRCKK